MYNQIYWSERNPKSLVLFPDVVDAIIICAGFPRLYLRFLPDVAGTKIRKRTGTPTYAYVIARVMDPGLFDEPIFDFPMVNHKGYRYPVDDSEGVSLVGNLNPPSWCFTIPWSTTK